MPADAAEAEAEGRAALVEEDHLGSPGGAAPFIRVNVLLGGDTPRADENTCCWLFFFSRVRGPLRILLWITFRAAFCIIDGRWLAHR